MYDLFRVFCVVMGLVWGGLSLIAEHTDMAWEPNHNLAIASLYLFVSALMWTRI